MTHKVLVPTQSSERYVKWHNIHCRGGALEVYQMCDSIIVKILLAESATGSKYLGLN